MQATRQFIRGRRRSRPRLRDARFLLKLIRKYRPDCLIANFSAVNLLMLIGCLTRVPCRVAWYHTMTQAHTIERNSSAFKLKLLLLRKRFVYRFATHVVPVSMAAREDLQMEYRVPRAKCRVFYNTLPKPDEATQSLRTQPLARLICVGRLIRCKGQDVLIEAIASLKNALHGTTIEFIGDGPLRIEYTQLAKRLGVGDQVCFTGSLPHSEVVARMASSLMTLVPSRSDNCPLVVIESLAVGTPIVASAVGGIVELFDDGEEGVLIPPDDPAELADQIKSLLMNPDLREAMSAKARQRFLRFEQVRGIAQQGDWFEQITASA